MSSSRIMYDIVLRVLRVNQRLVVVLSIIKLSFLVPSKCDIAGLF